MGAIGMQIGFEASEGGEINLVGVLEKHKRHLGQSPGGFQMEWLGVQGAHPRGLWGVSILQTSTFLPAPQAGALSSSRTTWVKSPEQRL